MLGVVRATALFYPQARQIQIAVQIFDSLRFSANHLRCGRGTGRFAAWSWLVHANGAHGVELGDAERLCEEVGDVVVGARRYALSMREGLCWYGRRVERPKQRYHVESARC